MVRLRRGASCGECAHSAELVPRTGDISLHHCLSEYFCMARFNLCVMPENTLSQFFEKRPGRGGLSVYRSQVSSVDLRHTFVIHKRSIPLSLDVSQKFETTYFPLCHSGKYAISNF